MTILDFPSYANSVTIIGSIIGNKAGHLICEVLVFFFRLAIAALLAPPHRIISAFSRTFAEEFSLLLRMGFRNCFYFSLFSCLFIVLATAHSVSCR